jgi:hypothetical protein
VQEFRIWALASLAVCGVIGLAGACGDNTPSFLPLSDLCSNIAADVCEARGSCCGGKDDPSCASKLQDSCEAARSRFVKDSSLSYDGAHAERVREDQRAAFLSCDAPFLVGQFFEGTRAAGKACQRDTQCESLLCDAKQKTCTPVESAPLCNSADK